MDDEKAAPDATREREGEAADVERADAAARRDVASGTEIEERDPGQNSEDLPQ